MAIRVVQLGTHRISGEGLRLGRENRYPFVQGKVMIRAGLTKGKQREEDHMAMNLEELAAEVMKLALEDRAQLASRLLLSLEEPSESEIEKLWLEEAERRLREFREGRVQGIPGDQVFRRAIGEIS